MNRLLEDIPSIPKVPSIAPLHLGITTRVLAKRLALEREKSKDLEKNAKENAKPVNELQSRRRSSRFLEGAAIPNSVIKAALQTTEPPIKDRASIKKERDEFVEKLTSRLQPHKDMYHSIYDEDVDRETLSKIKNELQRSLLPLTRGKQEDKKRLSFTTASNSMSVKADAWQELKEKRRISRRTSILAPLDGERRSTYESIKKAIQNSNITERLLDTDNIEEQKIKQIETGTFLKPSTEFKESMAGKFAAQDKLALQGSSYIKGLKKERRNEKKSSKRRTSLTSEKSLNLPNAERSSVEITTSSDSRRSPKRSDGKLLKEELGNPNSLVVTNVLQQRRNTN